MNLLRPTAVVLLAVNLLPLFAVLYFDWQVVDVLLLYWYENLIIGAVNVARMLITIRASASAPASKLMQVRARRHGGFSKVFFFVAHYGLFCYGHLMAIHALFGGEGRPEDLLSPLLTLSLPALFTSPFGISVIAIALSHVVSLFLNFIGEREFERTTPSKLMSRPYGRILLIHVTIVVGGALTQYFGSPVALLLVLVIVKTVMDWNLHEKERRVFATTSASANRASDSD